MVKKARTITDKDVNNGDIVIIEGTLSYARLTKHIEGEALIKDQSERERKNRPVVDKPYTTITLKDPVIIPMNPGEKTNAELYIEEHMYQKKAEPDPDNDPWYYGVNNKSKSLPRISVVDAKDKTRVTEIVPEGELATGQRVRVILRFYQSRNANAFTHKGVTFDHVIVMDAPIRYYNSDAVNQVLANAGMTFVPLDDAERAAAEARRAASNNTPVSMPTAQPVAAPTGNPFSNQAASPVTATAAQPQDAVTAPVQTTSAPIQTAPAPAPTPAPAAMWVCSCGHQNAAEMNFCNQCGARRTDSGTNPYAPAQTVDDREGGICYTPEA